MPASPAANHADTGLRIRIISIIKRLIGSIQKNRPAYSGTIFDSSTSWSLREIQAQLEFRGRIEI
jgi:hypothetical protein